MSGSWTREEFEVATGAKNEVDLSRSEADHFHLYRLFDFRKEPHLFSFRGAVDNHCHLDPITFHARFS